MIISVHVAAVKYISVSSKAVTTSDHNNFWKLYSRKVHYSSYPKH